MSNSAPKPKTLPIELLPDRPVTLIWLQLIDLARPKDLRIELQGKPLDMYGPGDTMNPFELSEPMPTLEFIERLAKAATQRAETALRRHTVAISLWAEFAPNRLPWAWPTHLVFFAACYEQEARARLAELGIKEGEVVIGNGFPPPQIVD